jgi:hypothetical protein
MGQIILWEEFRIKLTVKRILSLDQTIWWKEMEISLWTDSLTIFIIYLLLMSNIVKIIDLLDK